MLAPVLAAAGAAHAPDIPLLSVVVLTPVLGAVVTALVSSRRPEVAKQVAVLHSRTDRLETKIQYMPTPQQMSELQGDMQAMQATQEAIQRDITTVRISQNRIEDFLLKK